MNYETLDTIADSYNPILFLLYLGFSVYYWLQGDRKASLRGFLGILCCYLLMFIDRTFGLWESVSLDYSTHTAVAFALIIFHCSKRLITSLAAVSFLVSFVSYLLLMLYQQYHTVLDMFSTMLVLAPGLYFIYKTKYLAYDGENKN